MIGAVKPSVSRTEIIDGLTATLDKSDFVKAFWEGGAKAWNRVDEWSDIDAYLLVDEGRVEDAFNLVETILTKLSPIGQKYVIKQNQSPGLAQAFYRLERASEFVVLDIAIMTPSSPELFLEPEIHGKSTFYFNKTKIDETPKVDMKAFQEKSKQGNAAMVEKFRMFNNFVEKELNRDNSLEALEYYRTIIIPSLVQALRSKYTPMHYDFRMRYIHYELPQDTVRRLERLAFVTGMDDLEGKCQEAIQWFNELTSASKSSK